MIKRIFFLIVHSDLAIREIVFSIGLLKNSLAHQERDIALQPGTKRISINKFGFDSC
jgi:hypothetical protein